MSVRGLASLTLVCAALGCGQGPNAPDGGSTGGTSGGSKGGCLSEAAYPCDCGGGVSGAVLCEPDGGFGACMCPAPSSGGTSGGQGTSSGTSGGSTSGGTSGGGGTSSGSFGSATLQGAYAFTPNDGFAQSASPVPDAGSSLGIYLFQANGSPEVCGISDAGYSQLLLFAVGNSQGPIVPGAYTLYAALAPPDAGLFAKLGYYDDAGATFAVALATAGTLTISAFGDAGVSGSFNADMVTQLGNLDAGVLSGTFDVPYCGVGG